MGVYEDLLEWSRDRPAWQRDALRRLAQGRVTDQDIRHLADLAIRAASGVTVDEARPIEATDLPATAPGNDVRLVGLSALQNINALAGGGEITFGLDGITAIYGDNASGKSGYVRVLKKLCRARAAGGPIRPNVFAPVQGNASADVQFTVDGVRHEASWAPGLPPPEPLGRVGVYDRECASVYVTGENEVAYRPFGLDLLDQLAGVAVRVRQEIDRRRRDKGRTLVEVPPDVVAATSMAGRFPLRSVTRPAVALAGATWSGEDAARLADVEQALAEEHPAQRAGLLEAARNARLRVLEVVELHGSLASDEAIGRVAEARTHLRDRESALAGLRSRADFVSHPTDGGAWRVLWEAAERYSTEVVYRQYPFPYITAGATCVFCAQELSREAARRLSDFHEFVSGDISRQVDDARVELRALEEPLERLIADAPLHDQLLSDIAPDTPTIAAAAATFLEVCRARVAVSLDRNGDALEANAVDDSPAAELRAEVESLDSRIDLLRQASEPANFDSMQETVANLRAHRWLADNANAVRSEITRLKDLAVMNGAAMSCATNAITAESTVLTERYVTQELATAFETELELLTATRLPVQVARRGQRGATYHRIELRDTTVTGIRVGEVVSEGEFGAVALAAFLAETAHGDHASGVVLDDPVSSFDHAHRRSAAQRLVVEAQIRQVVVFTHDLVFLSNLEAAATEFDVPVSVLNLQVKAEGVGVAEVGPPWNAQRVPARIGRLQDDLARARRAHEEDDPVRYELLARHWYGALRETWERAVEEILFAEVVVRYRHGVESLRATRAKVWLIEEEDIRTLDAAMAKASAQMRGHDQPGAVNDPVPPPRELAQDLEVLQRWGEGFRERRR